MQNGVYQARPVWLPAAFFASSLAVLLVTPLALFVVGHWLPGGLVDWALWIAIWVQAFVFPFDARRMPDLPAGMQPGPNFRYELGTAPVILVWVLTLVLFGLLARGFKVWQTLGLAVLTIAFVSVLMQTSLRMLGFRFNPTFP